MGTPSGPKYIPYTYMDPLGLGASAKGGGVVSERPLTETEILMLYSCTVLTAIN